MDIDNDYKPYNITSVCKADLFEKFKNSKIVTVQDIENFTDHDMERIASKMSDAYCENGFWIDLEIITEIYLEHKKRVNE